VLYLQGFLVEKVTMTFGPVLLKDKMWALTMWHGVGRGVLRDNRNL
jgi:hypothetical protein